HAIQGAVVDDAPGIRTAEAIEERVRAVLGNERLLHHDVLTACGGKAGGVPRVDDAGVCSREKEGAVVCLSAFHRAAEKGPVTMIAATRVSPAAAELEAAGHWLRDTAGHVGRRNQNR